MNTKQKDFLSIDELTKNIKNKGLLIQDDEKLKDVLKHNNYYFTKNIYF